MILFRIARAAKDRHFVQLTALGEKHVDSHTGELTSWRFYSFPRLGFDAGIPHAAPARPAALVGCARLSELLATQPGRDFWWNQGVEVPNMLFELADGSPSWQALLAHLAP